MSRRSRILAATLLLAACRGDDARTSPATDPPPRAEFLVAAGDSTFWVVSDSAGIRFRGSPMLLARWDARFHEVYVVDDDRSYYDAVFVGQRVFRRDLLTGDSLLVYEDTLVARAADAWAAAHPGEQQLAPGEEGNEEPATTVTTVLDVVDVLGPWLVFERHVDAHVAGAGVRHVVEQGVIDLRSGERATLATLFGAREAARIGGAGRLAFLRALDTVRASGDPRVREALPALAGLAFDEHSFALVDEGGAPAVGVVVPGRDAAAGLALPLDPIAAQGDPPAWWGDARAILPAESDSLADRWPGSRYAVIARYDTSAAALLVIRAADGREFAVGRIPFPAHSLWRLDDPPIDREARRALVRAFDESALYSEDSRIAAAPQPRLRAVSRPR